jgi:prepilin-type N-terminal cleavage/methylation domain-containing protein
LLEKIAKMSSVKNLLNKSGITLIEVIIVIAIIGILAAFGIPEISRFSADYRVRSSATELLQNMRIARAMAIKENRKYLIVFDLENQRYLIGFDGDDLNGDGIPEGDGNLMTPDSDTFGTCKDIDNDGLPEGDVLLNGVPGCVRVVNLGKYGNNIIFGYTTGIAPAQGPKKTAIPLTGVNFKGSPPSAEFEPDGSMDKLGSVYFQHIGKGISYCVRISNSSGNINMWKWDGDKDHPESIIWRELR